MLFRPEQTEAETMESLAVVIRWLCGRPNMDGIGTFFSVHE